MPTVKKVAITFDKELAKRTEMFSTLGIKHKPRDFPIYDVEVIISRIKLLFYITLFI